jgi:hypothetical protein
VRIPRFQQLLAHNLHRVPLPKFRTPLLSKRLHLNLNQHIHLKRITRHIVVAASSMQVIAGRPSLRIPHRSIHPFHLHRFHP